jgi:glutamyl-tRNA reductase
MLLVLFLGIQAGASIASASEPELQASFDALEKDLDRISEHSLDILNAGEEAFREKMETMNQDLDAKVDDLEAKLNRMTGESKDKIREMIQSLKEKNNETLEKAKAMLAEAKTEFEEQLDDTMLSLRDQIDDLKKQSETMTKEAREKMARQLDELHKKNKEILGKLEALMAQGGQSWKEIKALVFQILEDLKDAFERGMDTSRLKKV